MKHSNGLTVKRMGLTTQLSDIDNRRVDRYYSANSAIINT